MQRIGSWLAVSAGGLLLSGGGLFWDAAARARRSGLEGAAAAENPAHVLLVVGLAALAVGVIASVHAYLSATGRLTPRARSLVAGGLAASVIASGGGALALQIGAPEPPPPVTTASDGPRSEPGEAASAPSGSLDVSQAHDHAEARQGAPTPEQRVAAERLVEETKLSLERFTDVDAALSEGYRAITPGFLRVVHYIHDDYMQDGRILDPRRPESLVYVNTPRGQVLAGAMYVMPLPGMRGPRIGGPLTDWHIHDDLCFNENFEVVWSTTLSGACPEGSTNRDTPEMLHVWTAEHPQGPFGHSMNPILPD